ncbi:hypothetical protein Tco_1105600 [Tanacetum coccineum]
MRRIGTMQTFEQQTSYFKDLQKISIHLLIYNTKCKGTYGTMVKMLLEGSEYKGRPLNHNVCWNLNTFHQIQGETIHDYYVRFAKLINDMRNIKTTMSKIQLNSKFVNNMLPEWGRFVTAVKLNKGLKDSKFDQLYAYLKQHEVHANENKMMLDRLTQQTVDPLALKLNALPPHYHSQSSTNPPTTYHQPHSANTSQYDLGLSPTDNLIENLTNTLALLTQSYKTFLLNKPINSEPHQTKESSYSTVRLGLLFKCFWVNRTEERVIMHGVQVSVLQLAMGLAFSKESALNPKRPQNLKYFKTDVADASQRMGVVLDEEQLLFTSWGRTMPLIRSNDYDAYDSGCCEAPRQNLFRLIYSSADTVYDEVGSSYDSEHLSVYVKDNAVPVVQNNASMVPNDAYVMIDNDVHESDVLSVSHTPRNTVVNNSLNAELAIYKEQVELYEDVLLMVDEVTSLKKDFNQKENKYLEEFLDLKALKDKVEDKLFKQGQSIQTVHMMCKPRSYYDEVNKVAIGYKNPLCLHRARQAQPALYSGHVIVTPNHAPAVVRDGEETLELTEISRKKMHEKMKANECVDNKVNITPPNYSKENFLATFTPQKQLTPEQIFWSQDIVKMKAEALKEQNTRPIKALTVYPPNTPATLVPRVLLTKSQVKINIFTLRQLFSDFEKTCKKRITPTGITEGERGFEQQRMLFTELKLDHVLLIGKRDAIDRKNLFFEHDNYIADGLSSEVFYVASDSRLKVNGLQEQNELFRAENAKIKQHYKELYDSIKITRAKHTEQITALKNENESLKVQLQNTVSCVTTNQVKPKVLAPGKYAIDVEPIPPRNRNNREVHLVYLRHLKESVDTLREIVEEAKVERPLDRSLAFACRYTKHSQELLEYVFGTCPKVFNQQDKKHAHTPRKKQVTFEDQIATSSSTTHKHVEPMHTQKSNVPVPPSIGVNSCTDAADLHPRSILKNIGSAAKVIA